MIDLHGRARSCRSPRAVDPGHSMPHARAPEPCLKGRLPAPAPPALLPKNCGPRPGGAAAPVDGGMQDGRRAGRRRPFERPAGRQAAGGVAPARGEPPPALGRPKVRAPHRTLVAAFPPCPLLAPSVTLAPRRRRPSCRAAHRAGCACPSRAQCAHQCGPLRPCAASAGLSPRRARAGPAGSRAASPGPFCAPAGGALREKEQGRSAPHAALGAKESARTPDRLPLRPGIRPRGPRLPTPSGRRT